MNRLIRSSLCLLLWIVGLAAAVPARAAMIDNPDDQQQAITLLLELSEGKRVRTNLKQLRALLKRYDALDQEHYERAWKLLEQIAHEHVRARQAELREQLNEAIAALLDDLRAALPELLAVDYPNDDGTKIRIYWRPVPGAVKYRLERKDITKQKDWHAIDTIKAPKSFKIDDKLIRAGWKYQYRVVAILEDGSERQIGPTPEVSARRNWIHTHRIWFAGLVVVLSIAVFYYIQLARRGVDLKIRKIAGLEAVDEAVGRATEMGRPILFIPGILDMNDIQTVAGLIILGRVARVAAEHDAILEVPTSKSLVMTTARETVQTSYIDVGRPDAYDEKKIYYTTDEQFGYVAAVTGTMVREKPATCFYMGAFFAESLILAETANMTGSIQIAGTAMPAQLPFFVAACDYTLIGEEFFAASAYLSGDPQQLGSLKGQDVGKLLSMILIAVGSLLATLAVGFGMEFSWPGELLQMLIDTVLRTTG